MKILLSAIRGLAFESVEFQLTCDTLNLDCLIPFRHKIEKEYALLMRSSFATTRVGYENVAGETDLVYYQI